MSEGPLVPPKRGAKLALGRPGVAWEWNRLPPSQGDPVRIRALHAAASTVALALGATGPCASRSSASSSNSNSAVGVFGGFEAA